MRSRHPLKSNGFYDERRATEAPVPIINPAPSTQKSIDHAWRVWQRHCEFRAQAHPERFSDPEHALRSVDMAEIKTYIDRYIETHHRLLEGGKAGTLFSLMRVWRMMYKQRVREFFCPRMRLETTAYIEAGIRGNLGAASFTLSKVGADKPVMSVDDLYNMQVQFWVFSKSYYPTERCRVQHSFLLLLMAYSTGRPSTFVATQSYQVSLQTTFGEACLRYRDIELFLIVNPDRTSKVKQVLGMRVRLRLLKGKRDEGVPPILFFHERDDNLSFCPILHLLALAFDDKAFASNRIKTPSDINKYTVPGRLVSLPIHWKPEIRDTAVLRAAVKTECGWRTSATEGVMDKQMSDWTQRLGKEAGFFPPPKLYSIRRGAGNAIDKNATPAVRNKIMGHDRSEMFTRYYTPQMSGVDTQSAFLQTPQKTPLVELAGHMSFTRDPEAKREIERMMPVRLHNAIAQDIDVQDIMEELASLKLQGQNEFGSITKAKGHDIHKAYISLMNTKRAYTNKIRREVELQCWTEYFSTIGDREIEKQALAMADDQAFEPKPEPTPNFKLTDRNLLAKLMCNNIDCEGVPLQVLTEARSEALEALIRLCGKVEPRVAEQNRKRSSSPEEGESDGPVPFQETFTIEHCPWCFFNERCSYEYRMRTWATPSNLRRHIDEMHLARRTYTHASTCPFPECPEILHTEMSLRVHLARKHTLVTPKKRTCRAIAAAGAGVSDALSLQSPAPKLGPNPSPRIVPVGGVKTCLTSPNIVRVESAFQTTV